MRARIGLLFALVLALAAPTPARAAKSPRKAEVVWTAPDFADYDVRSIAFLPVATYDHSLEARQLVEGAVGQALRGTGYRWVSTLVTREWLLRAGGDSLLNATRDQILNRDRVDSLAAPLLSRTARARALLAVRVDRMERVQLEYNQSGKPTTTVQLHASLVDSTGRLLWTAHGSETMEGPYQDPANGSLGVQAGGLNNQMVTGRLGAPSYPEVLTRLLARWTPQFPARPPAAVPN
jgi:hypothetical protein